MYRFLVSPYLCKGLVAWDKLLVVRGGGYSTNFFTGRLHPEGPTLTLLYVIFTKKVPLWYTLY